MRGFISRYLKFVKSQIEPSPSELKGLFILIFIALLGIGYDYYQKITSPVANIKEAGESEVLRDTLREKEIFVVERRKFYKRKRLREGEKININKASISELTRLPGVGPKIAERIYEYRKQVGKFKSVEELLNVKGIGPKKLEKMRPYITL
ncbi:MAG: ComEA family DNA-binding protein [Candidatus Caldipriscus sp.]